MTATILVEGKRGFAKVMNKKPLGCLTISGFIAALLTLLVVTGIEVFRGGVVFSPGALNAMAGAALGGVTSHSELITNCSACHPAFWTGGTMTEKCVSCHTDIASQWQDPTTLHGNLQKNSPGLTCRSCHPDHLGPAASLTDLSKVAIDHNTFHYSLTAHQHQADGTTFTCTSCHVNGYTKFDQSICTNCHQGINAAFMQTHIQAYGVTCLGCHDGIDSYGHAFNHSNVAFHLTGKHAQVACADCHNGARTIADLKTTPQACVACHQKNDAHHGQFGTDCAACHSTTGWTPANFDHNLSSFKLTGAHATVPCTSCHINNVFKGTPSACSACHQDPAYHAGLFAGTTCDTCHTTTGWSPAAFNEPHPANCGERNCLDHHRATCADCHPVNLMTSSCLKCHDSNNPGEGNNGN